MAARSASTNRHGRERRSGRRDGDSGRSRTAGRFATIEPERSRSSVRSNKSGRDGVTYSRKDHISRCSTSSSSHIRTLERRTSRVMDSSFSMRAEWVSRYSEESRRSRDGSQERVQYFGLPRMDNGRRDLKDWIDMERRMWRRCGGLKMEESRKPSRIRQPMGEKGSSRRSWVGDVARENAKCATTERGKEGVLAGRTRNWGRCSPVERRGVSSRRVDRGSPVSNARVEDKRVHKYHKDKESQNVAAKLGPERRDSSNYVRGSRDGKGQVVDQEGSSRHDAQQDSALEKDKDEEFEEMLKRNREYFEAATLPMEFEQYFDQRSQGEESGSMNESSLGVNIYEHKEVEGGEGRDGEVSSSGVQKESEETDVELKRKADLNKTVSVHSSPEVEVMGDVETTSEEEEEANGTAEQYVETRESVEKKVKEVAKQRAANFVNVDRLKRDLKACQEEIMLAREEEKSLEVKEQKLQVRVKTMPLQKRLRR